MLPIMSRELVRTGKSPSAALPRASVWFFTGVRALVSLKVRALGVNLAATLVVALVDPLRWLLDAPPFF